MTIELILISSLFILIWLISITLIKGLIDNSLSTYNMLFSATVVSIAITLLVVILRSSHDHTTYRPSTWNYPASA